MVGSVNASCSRANGVCVVWRRCEVGTQHWAQCNDSPIKYARYPVTGLVEGRSYVFRVSALNAAGVSRPSRVSDPVAAVDPSDRARQRGEETERDRERERERERELGDSVAGSADLRLIDPVVSWLLLFICLLSTWALQHSDHTSTGEAQDI